MTPSAASRTDAVRILVIASRFNEVITRRLVEGARGALRDGGVPDDCVIEVWVDGAFELPAVASAAARHGSVAAIVALGAVIRGETPHFEFIASETARGLMDVAVTHGMPVGFGVLTVETFEQAAERAGGAAGNKGHEAADAVLRALSAIGAATGHAEA